VSLVPDKMKQLEDQIRKLHTQNKTWAEIGRLTGYAPAYVKRIGLRLGLSNSHMAGGHYQNMDNQPAAPPKDASDGRDHRTGAMKAGTTTLPPLESLQVPLPVVDWSQYDFPKTRR